MLNVDQSRQQSKISKNWSSFPLILKQFQRLATDAFRAALQAIVEENIAHGMSVHKLRE